MRTLCEDAVHVGDTHALDYDGAIAAGLRAVLLNRTDDGLHQARHGDGKIASTDGDGDSEERIVVPDLRAVLDLII